MSAFVGARVVITHQNQINKCCFSTTQKLLGKKNPSKFPLFAFRWTKDFRKRQAENPDPNIIVYKYGVREPVFKHQGKVQEVPEMIPELIVPDLKDFKLTAYVSYRTEDVVQSEFTARDLFDAVYSRKIEDDFRLGLLDENGQPKKPSSAESLTPDRARKLARQTGSDIFQ